MNQPELTQDQKRIRIAEACGWTAVIFSSSEARKAWEKPGVLTPEGFSQHWDAELPDYFGDLNAMHEAEKALPPSLRNTYCLRLCWAARLGEGEEYFRVHCATAEERAEAFGRTLNLW